LLDQEIERCDRLIWLKEIQIFAVAPEERCQAAWVAGKEDVMAKLIVFYVPANFQTPKKRWTPEELRGKIINFHACTTRKSA
jgi:hypothetical protein